jgi:hypothetical protein
MPPLPYSYKKNLAFIRFWEIKAEKMLIFPSQGGKHCKESNSESTYKQNDINISILY